MNTFFGLMVLTGPLFLIVLWVPVCIALAVWVSRKFIKKALPLKIVGGMAVFWIVLVLPIVDEIAGRIYLNYLCETQAGAKVYQTIELPVEYWDEDGKPKFYVNWDTGLGKKYSLIYTKGAFSTLFHVDNAGYKFVDKQTDEVLGEIVNFRYGSGWLLRNFNPSNTSNSCELKEEIINDIFIPENKTKGTNHGNNQ